MNIGMIYGAIIFISFTLYAVSIFFVKRHDKFVRIWTFVWYGYISALVMMHLGRENVSDGINYFAWIVLIVWAIVHSIYSFDAPEMLALAHGEE